jgi:hypothetical protein
MTLRLIPEGDKFGTNLWDFGLWPEYQRRSVLVLTASTQLSWPN